MLRLALLALLSIAGAAAQWTHVATHALPPNTHRPEILALDNGEFIVVTVSPEGPMGVGRIKHKAYRFDAHWNPVGVPFVVTRITPEFGEPADHRVALVNGELVVFYQSLVFREDIPVNGPAENAALEQSLMMARFSLDGQELDRRAVVPHRTDFSQDNFPDFCILWRDGRFLVETGAQGPNLTIREVTPNGDVLATHSLRAAPGGIGGSIGNSMLDDGGHLYLLSSTAPDTGMLTITELNSDFQAAGTVSLADPGREQSFPVGSITDRGGLLVTYIARPRGGPNDLLNNPYGAYLKVLDGDLHVRQDLMVGEGGFSHVHPTVTKSGVSLFVAWSRAVDMGGHQAPQCQVEEFARPVRRPSRK